MNDFRAYDGFATGRITNSTINNMFGIFDAANVSVIDSIINGDLGYGLVCTRESLSIIDNTITGWENCRNTTTLINSIYPSPELVSVSALASSSVKIFNNESILLVYSHDSSSVDLENISFSGMNNDKMITCTDYSNTVVKNNLQPINIYAFCYGNSNLTIQNINFIVWSLEINQYDRSSTTIKNCTIVGGGWGTLYQHCLYNQSTSNISNITLTGALAEFLLESYDSSVVDVANVNATAAPGIFWVNSFNSSIVDIVNATNPSPSTPGNVFCSFDLSVMTITDSDIWFVGFAVVSDGYMSVTNGILSGYYINTTTWINPKSLRSVALASIAVVGTDEATITDSNLGASIYLHDSSELNVQDSQFSLIGVVPSTLWMYDTSRASVMNSTFLGIIISDRSSLNLFNITAYTVYIWDSATMICSGSLTMETTLENVYVYSNIPLLSNVIIDTCTVTEISGITWIQQPPILPPIKILLWLIIIILLLLILTGYPAWI